MEDFSAECVCTLPSAPAEQRRHLCRVGLAGIAIGALTIAAWALSETVQRG
ncbi:MAG: hypothetical protein M3Q19_00740 [Pseudomonadota bacterium]|nr:hypothetical protein [Pseudomonadota bacterium]